MIESYEFGKIKIKGETFTQDLIIFPEKINPSWWRKSGHRVSLQDLDEVFAQEPEILIIGTGYASLMKVDEEVKKCAQRKGITLIVENTRKAVKIFNDLHSKKRVIAAFHLTC